MFLFGALGLNEEVWVGRENSEGWDYGNDSLWGVYAWDGKKFVQSKQVSTTPKQGSGLDE